MITEAEQEEINSFINNWNEKNEVGGRRFDELFSIGGVPLWWFYRRLIVRHVLPKPLNTYHYVYGEKFGRIRKKIYGANSYFSRKYLLHAENRKIDLIGKEPFKDYPNSKSSKVLFLSYSNHLSENQDIFRLNKLINLLKHSKKAESFVVFADPLSRRLSPKLKEHNNIYQYCGLDEKKKALMESNTLAEKWKSITDQEKDHIFLFQSKSLWPFLRPALNFFFSKEMIYLTILYYEAFKKMIDQQKISIGVISGMGSLFERCYMAAAKEKKIPTLAIAHGIGAYILQPDILYKTKFAVFSEYYKERYVSCGIPQDDVIAIGPLVYDEIFPFKDKKNREENLITIATSPFVETGKISKNEYFARIRKMINELNADFKLNIKLHPREKNLDDYQKVAKKFNQVTILPSNLSREEFYRIISKSSLFFHFGSNSALEAMILNKPIITYNIINDIQKINNWIKGVDIDNSTIEINYGDSIIEAVRTAILDDHKYAEKRDKIVNFCCGNVDGLASKRAFDIISNLIDG